jgi:hypothetical protein
MWPPYLRPHPGGNRRFRAMRPLTASFPFSSWNCQHPGNESVRPGAASVPCIWDTSSAVKIETALWMALSRWCSDSPGTEGACAALSPFARSHFQVR